jgi:putative transcriptional regulator
MMKTSSGRIATRTGAKKPSRTPAKPPSSGSRILSAITEATEVLRTEGLQSKQLTVRTYKLPEAPPIYRPRDVKRVRELLGASQAVLAGFLGVNINTLRSWEQGKRPPQPIACRFLFEIESDITKWRRRILNEVSPIEIDD